MHRFFVPKEAVEGAVVRLPRHVSRQIRRVLRLRPGDTVVVFDGTGSEHTARIARLEREGVQAEIVATSLPQTEPSARLTLCIAIVKADRLELALEKCTELGAARFLPVITERVQGGAAAAPFDRRLARWRSSSRSSASRSRSRMWVSSSSSRTARWSTARSDGRVITRPPSPPITECRGRSKLPMA